VNCKCHVVDDLARHSFLRGKAQLPQFDGARLHHSSSITFALTRLHHNSPTLHSPRLTLFHNQNNNIVSHHSIAPNQHHLLHAQFRHSSTLRIPLRRLTSNPTLPPSAAVSVVHQSPLVYLRLSHARRHHSSRTGWLVTPVHRQPDNLQTNSLQPCPR
jgi:hypothetical protein